MTARYIVRRNGTDLALGREFLNRSLDWVDAPFASVFDTEQDAHAAAALVGIVSHYSVTTI